jgi:hypothetical protein
VGQRLRSVLFGFAADQRSSAPLLQISLADIERLPSATEVRTWRPDSSWAWTRCEVLAHELAEAIEYRRIWDRRPTAETLSEANHRFRERSAVAHAYALEREGAVADAQRTRENDHHTAYMRTGFCNVPELRTLRVVFDRHTESLVFVGNVFDHVVYSPNRVLCPGQ